MRVRLTHLVSWRADNAGQETDALGRAEGPSEARILVPGWLPCGECGRCRRGWTGACPRGRALFAEGAGRERVLDLPDRFLTSIDEPAGVAALSDDRATCAGILAGELEAMARAGTGPGDVVIWIGRDVHSILGARTAVMRGCRTFTLGQEQVGSGAQALSPTDRPDIWNEMVSAASPGGAGNFQERRIFASSADADSVSAAVALAEPGSTIVFLRSEGAASLRPAALPSCRILVGQPRHYHPDFVVDALAALRNDSLAIEDLLVTGDGVAPPDRLIIQRLAP